MNKKEGFTLLELVIVMALISVVGLLLMSVFLTSHKSNKKNEALQKRTESVRLVSHIIDTDIRKSSQELTLTNNGTCYDLTDSVDSSSIEYCFKNNSVFRQGSFLIDEVNDFQIKTLENKGFMIMIEDSGGEKYEQTIYFRQAQTASR
ncbi:type II secretion system protein [Erysipelothrix urinaevulpis]|uniref:type II secretion system protein n=1 Tax=Erysipelothrix urinaevulpis TaxID=2683717 RepID=UPI00135B8C34|nr:type II secretion system protein [Erysipelothrix urinaevulpis]